MMRLKIGTTDIAPLVAFQGVQWTRTDYCPKTVTTMDGKVWRGRVDSKASLSLTFRPLTLAQLQSLLDLVKNEYITVTYDDPVDGYAIKTMYAESLPAKMMVSKVGGTEYWSDVNIVLKER